MSEKMDSSVFLKIPLFKDLPKQELYELVNELPMENYKAGDYIFYEGEPGNSLYVVQKGNIEVVLAGGTNEEMLLRTCGPGEYVGEMSLILKQGKRTASVRVRDDSQLWMMTRDKFNECIQRWPHLAYAMVEIISERLESSNEAAFHDFLIEGMEARLPPAESRGVLSGREGLEPEVVSELLRVIHGFP